jgi:RNA polymerase sigma-70 factor (ECF subfamily)
MNNAGHSSVYIVEAGMVEEAMVGSVGLGRSKEGPAVLEGRSLSDGDIINAVKKGDRQAYCKIVDRYKRRAYLMALGLVSEPQDALDVSQAAFIKAYRNINRFDVEKPFMPWFYRILHNLCLDHIRRSRRRREVPLSEALILADDPSKREIHIALRQAIDDLPPEHREVVILHYFEGLSYKEMASTLGKPIGTVMSTLYHARQNLKIAIKGSGFSGDKGE